ncbi:hypothetical protein [Nocardioides sp. B-3]|uniref:hypothetical protein n=1 Tax=Nocardioides sp. B-3 TaxID=2895565 RepID=UPI0021535FD3|nr:hypothetical protein [Nocardioides sp. B-3]UUZ58147.1 hypothetical protein LP418_17965 [Nocardioides sp. B-3]
MKSGTSFIQSRLFANKPMLPEERGIPVPGMNWLSRVMAARDVLGSGEEQWAKMAGKVNAHDGTSVISMEYLGPVRAVVAERVVASFPSHSIDVVITARDLNRSIAAMWQETVQNGRTRTFAEYLAGIEARRPGHRAPDLPAPPESGRTFWRQQNLARLARTWGALAPVSLVTVPPPGAPRELLWERFCSVLGTPPGGFRSGPDGQRVGRRGVDPWVIRRLNELLNEQDLGLPGGHRPAQGAAGQAGARRPEVLRAGDRAAGRAVGRLPCLSADRRAGRGGRLVGRVVGRPDAGRRAGCRSGVRLV